MAQVNSQQLTLTKAEQKIIHNALRMALTSSNRAIKANQDKDSIRAALEEQTKDIEALIVKLTQSDLFK